VKPADTSEKKQEYLKGKINELAKNCKNTNIRDLYRGMNEFNWGYQPRSNLNNNVFWVVTPCGYCKNRRFGGTWRLLHQGDKNR
jgi:hypothetical protein